MEDLVDKIMEFENSEMSDQDTIAFFQELIDHDLVSQLQGSYGRMAASLVNSGLCTVMKGG